MQIRTLRGRIEALERFLLRRRPQIPVDQIRQRALRQLSDEDLEVLIWWQQAGVPGRDVSEQVQAALDASMAIMEEESRRAGFRSWADVQHCHGE
jgi:hypothetical protein